ncbi:MAG: ABC transporter ATP-binding protein [Bacteroidetes bacterium]|nr:ABC transporter ATP-binding protein [Bacteroidota bacterium]MCL2303128.1 ABC transporter ATP-binding protein [Lentimicrobiaceae bacterium]
MPAISIDKISKRYGKVNALTEISFEVQKGEVFGLIGPDGAGKTSLFNILATLQLPTSGKATLLGLDVISDYKKIRKEIGYLPGVFSLYPDLSVYENLRFFATMYGNKIDENMHLIAPIWDQIAPFKTRQAGRLSGGMKQKLALCCALIHKPKILFLDEPTTGVDPVSRKEFWDLLNTIKQQGIAVLVSTPYMDEATRCDKIALMKEGKIITINTPVQIIENYKGKLYSLKPKAIFDLLNYMPKCPIKCNYYPYGEFMHVSFYETDFNLQHFTDFLAENQQTFSELTQIQPTIEDCFIELVTG